MNGIIVIDKPMDYTSHDIIAIMSGILHEKHLGHTGTLDPNATGVLPICVGFSTKLIEYMDCAKKTYVCTAKLGTVTDTQDIWGEILESNNSDISKDDIEKILPSFLGEIEQVPSKYSAIRVNGRRLYSYAHAGDEVEIPKRKVTIYSIDFLDFNKENQEFSLSVTCSRGTYIRTICHDIGQLLGVGACMKSLRRISCSGYDESEAIDFEKLRKMDSEEVIKLLKPMESAVSFMDRVDVTEEQRIDFANGKHMKVPQNGIEMNKDICVFCNNMLVGIGSFDNPNRVKPRKVFNR